MNIPLIQDVQKDDINTSLIAIKREKEQLASLIATANEKIAELNSLMDTKVNVSDIVNEVTSGNMHSVTSNAVYDSLNTIDSWTSTGIYLYKLGKVVFGLFSGGLTGSGGTLITTVPSRFKPIKDVRVALINNVVDRYSGQFVVYALDGKIKAYPTEQGSFSSGIVYNCSFMYMTN